MVFLFCFGDLSTRNETTLRLEKKKSFGIGILFDVDEIAVSLLSAAGVLRGGRQEAPVSLVFFYPVCSICVPESA